MFRKLVFAMVLTALSLGPAHAQDTGVDDRVRVVATFSILADMVREVGGDRIALTTIVGRDRSPHTFEPTPSDARALGRAQLLVHNGLGFESWLPRLLEASAFKGLDLIASTGVQPLHLDEEAGEADHDDGDHGPGHDGGHHHHAGDIDPHAWQDLGNGVIYVRNIAEGLAQIDPAHAVGYRRRAQAYTERLRAEDRSIRDQIAAIPAEKRIMMTSHDAFGYFGHAYGVRLISIVGISSDARPTARAISTLIDRIRAQHIHALFLENAANPKLMEQIARETGVRIGGTLYSDALGPVGHEAGTYLGMFKWNAQQLLDAFER
ncbi:MAG: zinc ABC transporter substrate-binding protein [Alcaligenaceae bacterium]|nr:zinc ABC transporter substrate-binding protein [Alcaligenaceae bacterium]